MLWIDSCHQQVWYAICHIDVTLDCYKTSRCRAPRLASLRWLHAHPLRHWHHHALQGIPVVIQVAGSWWSYVICHCYFISFSVVSPEFFSKSYFIWKPSSTNSNSSPLSWALSPWDQPSPASIHLTTLGQAWVRIDEATIHRTTDDLMDQGCSPLWSYRNINQKVNQKDLAGNFSWRRDLWCMSKIDCSSQKY